VLAQELLADVRVLVDQQQHRELPGRDRRRGALAAHEVVVDDQLRLADVITDEMIDGLQIELLALAFASLDARGALFSHRLGHRRTTFSRLA
jgi:hypothetical protein